jgi:hypothetical protein
MADIDYGVLSSLMPSQGNGNAPSTPPVQQQQTPPVQQQPDTSSTQQSAQLPTVQLPTVQLPQTSISDQSQQPQSRIVEGVSLNGVDPRIAEIIGAAAQALPPGYTVRPTSGLRTEGQGQHTLGKAADWQIIDADGKPVSNRGDDTTGLYTTLARNAYGYQEKNHPELTGQFQWGAQFGTSAKNPEEPDLMHFDIGGRRGHIAQYSRETIGAVLPPVQGTPQQQEQQPLTIPPIVYPWQAMNPASVTIADVMQQQQQRETGNIAFVGTSTTTAQSDGDINADALNSKLGGAFAGKGQAFTDAAKKYNISPALLASISMAETGNGTSNMVQTKNNPAGIWDAQSGTYRSFDSIESGLDFTARNLKNNYIDQGLTTPEQIGPKYAPVGASNDPNKTNATWPALVNSQLQKLGVTGPLIAADGSQQAAGQPGPIVYPWQMASNLTPDAINGAIQQALSRNAFASTAPGVPAGYNPPGTQTGTQPSAQQNAGLVLSQAGDPDARTKPESFGLRVATNDDVKQFDAYVKNGGDINAISPYDRLAVLLNKNPKALLDPNNKQMLDEMVLQPQQQAANQKGISEKVWDAIGQGGAMFGDIANSVGALVRTGWNDAAPVVRGLAEKATGQTPDPEALAGLADVNSLAAQGVGKTVSDVYNMVSSLGLGAGKLAVPIASMFTNDPQKLAEIHNNYLEGLQKYTADQQWVSELGNNLQGTLANAYSATGAFADLGQKLKTWQSDPAAVEGISQIAQLVGPSFLEGLAGMKAVGAFKPAMVERALESTTDVAEARARKFMFDSTQVTPRNAAEEAANPNYLNSRAAQANLAPDARAADAAFTQEDLGLQQKLTSLNKIAGDPGTATQFAQTIAGGLGNAAGAIGGAVEKLNGLGDRTLNALSLGSPTLRGLYDKIGRGVLWGASAMAGHAWAGRLLEMGVDSLEHAEAIPKVASGLQDFFKTYAQESAYAESSVPFWTRMSQGTKLVAPRMAAFLDSPAVQTIAAGVKGAPAGMAAGAFIGALGDPNDPLSGAVSGAIPGGLFGMVGGGFGQWQRYGSPGEVYMQARGDWQRTLSTFAGPQRDQFLSLQPKDQLMLSTYLQQVPGLRVNFTHDPTGVAGQFDPHIHTFDTANKPTITINTANPQGTVRAIFAHELMHATQSAGMTPDIYDALLGNVDRDVPGQYTALDAKGKPIGVDPATSRFTTNPDFQKFKNSYVTSLASSDEPTSHLSDLDIAREMFAEHGVDHLLSAQGAVDATSAFRPGWINQNMLKNSYAKLGFVFDRQSNLVQGTHLFDGVRPNDAIDKLTQKYFQTRFRERAIDSEEQPTRNFRMEDLRTTNAADTFLNTAPEIMRNSDGSVLRDSRGIPMMRSPSQVKQYNAKLANDTLDRINALPEDRKNDIGYKILPNGNVFVRYLPQELRDGLEKTSEYNLHQIRALDSLSEALADKSRMGTNFRLFYNKALSENKRYGSFSGTEKYAVPYGFTVSKNDNVLLSSVDFDQLNQNYLKNATRSPFKELWGGNPGNFVQDANSYFENHKRGEPGATGIGDQKRDAINALLNLDTSVNRDANPLIAERGKPFPGTRPIIKSYRIDRASQVTPTEMTSPFTTEAQYHRLNRNYRPRF